ncbi:neuropeptide y receptor [Plakobranchus ocellatus]|uniref:Neuropeptide y receptor n=1 Tax=Plakobranchus ocellatus TaxID=259542 RepID=A0AAV4CJL6_9GAST|nr:neuropeptide y receptor [Plakobranchus ocellatus]
MSSTETSLNMALSSDIATSSPLDNWTGNISDDWEDSHLERVIADTKKVSMVMYPLLCVVAALGNVCVVYIVVSKRRMRSNVTNYFIASLAVSDVLMALVCVPTNYVSNILLDYWPFGSALCPLVTYLQVVIVFQNAYTMLAMSLERYIAIMHPFLQRLGKRRCLQVVGLCWLLAFLTPIPTAVTARLHEHPPEAGYGRADSNIPNVSRSEVTGFEITTINDLIVDALVQGNSSNYSIGADLKPRVEDNGYVEDQKQNGFHNNSSVWLCYEGWGSERQRITYTITVMILQYFLPLGVLVFTYARIVHVIWLKDKQPAAPGQLLASPPEGQESNTQQSVTYAPSEKGTSKEKETDPRKKVNYVTVRK